MYSYFLSSIGTLVNLVPLHSTLEAHYVESSSSSSRISSTFRSYTIYFEALNWNELAILMLVSFAFTFLSPMRHVLPLPLSHPLQRTMLFSWQLIFFLQGNLVCFCNNLNFHHVIESTQPTNHINISRIIHGLSLTPLSFVTPKLSLQSFQSST